MGLLLLILILVVPSLVQSQVLGPKQIENAYTFKAGQRFAIRLSRQKRNPEKPAEDLDEIETARFVVESVDSEGNATLILRGTSQLTQIGEDTVRGNHGFYRGWLAGDPVYRVRLNKYGYMLDGEIPKRALDDSLNMEHLHAAHEEVVAQQDTNFIRRVTAQFLPVRHGSATMQDGDTWRDTSFWDVRGHSFYLGSHTAASSQNTPEYRRYYEDRYAYTAHVTSTGSIIVNLTEDKYFHSDGAPDHWHVLETDRRRSDSFSTQVTRYVTTDRDGQNSFGTTRETLDLIEDE